MNELFSKHTGQPLNVVGKLVAVIPMSLLMYNSFILIVSYRLALIECVAKRSKRVKARDQVSELLLDLHHWSTVTKKESQNFSVESLWGVKILQYTICLVCVLK